MYLFWLLDSNHSKAEVTQPNKLKARMPLLYINSIYNERTLCMVVFSDQTSSVFYSLYFIYSASTLPLLLQVLFLPFTVPPLQSAPPLSYAPRRVPLAVAPSPCRVPLLSISVWVNLPQELPLCLTALNLLYISTSVMGQVFIADVQMFPSLIMCNQLRTLRTISYASGLCHYHIYKHIRYEDDWNYTLRFNVYACYLNRTHFNSVY